VLVHSFDAVKKVNNFIKDEITFNNGVITRVLVLSKLVKFGS
jgi:hypothetical protein